MTDRPIHGLLNADVVVIFGASTRTQRLGGIIPDSLRRFGYAGDVIPVNPRHERVSGFPSLRSIADVPSNRWGEKSLVIHNRTTAEVHQALPMLAEKGYRNHVVLASGYAELDRGGAAAQELLATIAIEHDLTIVGPNCPGVANFHTGMCAYGATNFRNLSSYIAGPVAILSASGGMGNTIFSFVQERGIGCSAMVGLGNEAVLTSAAFLDHFAEDPETSTVLAYLEQIRSPAAFESALHRLAEAGKHVVVMKAGRRSAGASAVRSHTAALAGDGRIIEDVLTECGAIVVNEPEELADVAALLERPLKGKKVGGVSPSGGGKVLLADAAQEHGMSLPPIGECLASKLQGLLPSMAVTENPLDTTFELSDPALWARLVSAMTTSNEFDVVVYFPQNADPELAEGLARAVADEYVGLPDAVPLVVVWPATTVLESGAWSVLRNARIPLFTRVGPAFRSMKAVASRSQRSVSSRGTEASPSYRALVGSSQPQLQSHLQAQLVSDPLSVVKDFGIRIPVRSTGTATELLAGRKTWSWPIVAKVIHSEIPHRAKVGGISSILNSMDELASGLEKLGRDVHRETGLHITMFELQELVRPGDEWILATTTDQELGRVVGIGSGGGLVEVLDDMTYGRPATDESVIRSRLLRTRLGSALYGRNEGVHEVSQRSLVQTIVLFSELAQKLEAEDIEGTLEVNPVIVQEEGDSATAVDALWVNGSDHTRVVGVEFLPG